MVIALPYNYKDDYMYITYYSNRSYIQNIGPVRILYIIYSIMVTSLTQTNYYCNNSFTT